MNVRSRAVGLAAFLILIAVFVVDVLTPQTFVVAILLDVPIVLAALTRSRRLTAWLVGSALLADAVAAGVNATREGHWDAIGVGDRLLSVISIAVVGFLSTAVQQRSERVGRLAVQEARARREAALSHAADRIRASLSYDVVLRAVVHEAPHALDGTAAYWYPNDGAELLSQRGDGEVRVVDERPPPEIASLVHRVLEDGIVASVQAVDPVGRFVLSRLDAPAALALPLWERGNPYGVLLVAQRESTVDESVVIAGRAYATISVNALAQSRLFAELAARNEALSERQAVIRDLVSAISHDVRTPLAALALTMRQAADGAYGTLPDRYVTIVRDSLVSIEDLQRLAETLLLVARFETGERRPEQTLVDLGAIAREVVSEMTAMAQSQRVDLAADDNADALTRGSRADLRRALANLVANALRYTPERGHVRVQIDRTGPERIELRVIDDGYGVAPGLRAQLFERFATTGSAGGTGLGLYIVRRIAEEIGGSARYEANRPRGSIFILSLPAAAP